MTSIARQADELSTPIGIVEPLNSEHFGGHFRFTVIVLWNCPYLKSTQLIDLKSKVSAEMAYINCK